MNAASRTDLFAALWRLGYTRLVPVMPVDGQASPKSALNRPGAAGKAVGIRGRDGLWRGFDWVNQECDEDDIARWHAMGADVGIKGGLMDGVSSLVWIDADTKDGGWAALIAATVAEFFGDLPVRIGQSPKAAYPIRVRGEFGYARVEFGARNDKGALVDRVELLGQGRYGKALGIHPVTMQPYTWPRPLVPFAELPEVEPERLMAFLERLREILPAAQEIKREGSSAVVNQEALRGDPELVERIVRGLPNTSEHFPTRETYRDFGYAIKGSLPDDPEKAFELFEDWCYRWSDGENEPRVVEADWRRMKGPFKVGIGKLVEIAEAAAPELFSKADRWFDAEAAAKTGDGVGNSVSLFGGPEPTRSKIVLEKFDDVADTAMTQRSRPLIRGLLDQGALSVWYGESNVGKTFAVMDAVYHVTRGLPWGGMRTEAGAGAYIALEGGNGARKRAAALKAKYGPAPDFHYILSPLNLLDPNADLAPLIEVLRGIPNLRITAIDTLSRALAGGDENSSTDMGAMVRHLDAIRSAVASHIVVVHHTGKDTAKGARGHSLLRAATDTEVEISEGRIAVTKQRDLDREWVSGFELEPVVLGVTEDDEVVSSCTVRLTGMSVALTPPDLREQALSLVRGSVWRRDMRSPEWIGIPVAMGLRIDLNEEGARDRVRDIVATWTKEGALCEEIRPDKARRPRVYVTTPASVFD